MHRSDKTVSWHSMAAHTALAQLTSHYPAGLTGQDAADRLARHGPNRLPPPATTPAWRRFLRQFHNVLIYALLLSATVTGLLGHWLDMSVIIGVVVINAIIGFVQEGKAEQALDAIRKMLSLKAMVIRDGVRAEVPAESLVPGDLVCLQSGDKVPADLRLLEVKNLRVEEAAITGESLPVEKQVEPVGADTVLGDRLSMAFSGTLVSYGQGVGVVVATGATTELGKISQLLREVEPISTPLLKQMAKFAQLLTYVIAAVALGVFLLGTLWRGYPAEQMFLAVVGLAVAAIPEGLPAIMTITLAIGVRRMARRRAIIRQLPAVETLGALTVICSDKTGTLTCNEMTVRHVLLADRLLLVDGVGYAPEGGFRQDGQPIDPAADSALQMAALAGALCNEARLVHASGQWRVEGDPTEGALLTLAGKVGWDMTQERLHRPRRDVIPFESEYRFMASLHHDHNGQACLYLKGSPETVLNRCRWQMGRTGIEPLAQEEWRLRCAELAGRGERLLAVAMRDAGTATALRFDDVEGDLTLLAIVGMTDPPRAEARQSVAACHQAGIQVKMITGDHADTAQAIAQELGISGKVVTGQMLDQVPTQDWPQLAATHHVFARVSPEHKLKLVAALQAQQHVVAMTGDGVNDAPALKRADVGVAMGQNGTEAAKEAGTMVLADDHFATIVHAVEEGRAVYDNLQKALIQALPTNVAQACMVMIPIMLGMALPINAVQVLWVNMVCAVTLSLALAFEPAEANVMQRPPRATGEPLLSGFLVWRVLLVSALVAAASLALYQWAKQSGAPQAVCHAVAVNTLVFCQAFYLLNCRYLMSPVLNKAGLTGNPTVWLAIGALALQQAAFTYLPVMNRLFDTAPMSGMQWAAVMLAGGAVLLAVELEKAIIRRYRCLMHSPSRLGT
ncbi:magnesium-transporting ATPase (P-type) [Chitinivorax tropicus]|uniref:Magnesium-transporting ATPase (P-type) n=1 Tax=Chitinivorax tropicus TaxID=714531 RepID=A0A840MTA0_9PROT|nr:HAD-IC family P-type ATPase [Chitinivorax tropicus]MBB5019616.1 magnesium-transporting ATPase (P-type) [Chitinivorax tropicus]